MKNQIVKILFILSFSTSVFFSQSEQKLAEIGDLKLISGSTIENCIVGYRTFGKINEDSSNIIIFPTWFEGTTNDIARLIQKYSFLDTAKYFIIAIDALGNGVSSSPSNYNVYNLKSFPQITIRDIANSQYKLLTEVFKLKHIFAAVGGSLGGMQVLEWSVAHPDFISKIVAYVGTPKMSTYDLLWMNTQLNIIETGKRYGITEQEIRKSLAMIMAGLARTPEYIIEKTNPSNFQNYLSSFNKEYSQKFALEDYLFQIKAMINHDITLEFAGSMEEAAKSIKAKLFMIISEKDLLVNPTEAKRFAMLANAKILLLNNNCGHLAVSCEIDKCREEIDKFLSE
jgi:homoserine O-acetyltransferase/O-succinyltransferase